MQVVNVGTYVETKQLQDSQSEQRSRERIHAECTDN